MATLIRTYNVAAIGRPFGICHDGKYIVWLDATNNRMRWMEPDTGTEVRSTDISGPAITHIGLYHEPNSNRFWSTGFAGDHIMCWTAAGELIRDLNWGGPNNRAVVIVDDYLFVMDQTNNRIAQWRLSDGGFIRSFGNLMALVDMNFYGLDWDGVNFWCVGALGNNVYQLRLYQNEAIRVLQTIDIAAADGTPVDVCVVDKCFYVAGDEHDQIYKYRF